MWEERNQLISQLNIPFCDCMHRVLQFQNYILCVSCDQIIADTKYNLLTGLSHSIHLEKLQCAPSGKEEWVTVYFLYF